MGVTVVLLTCSYKAQEFVRIGYYVNNEYTDPELVETPPAKPLFDKVLYSLTCSLTHISCVAAEKYSHQ